MNIKALIGVLYIGLLGVLVLGGLEHQQIETLKAKVSRLDKPIEVLNYGSGAVTADKGGGTISMSLPPPAPRKPRPNETTGAEPHWRTDQEVLQIPAATTFTDTTGSAPQISAVQEKVFYSHTNSGNLRRRAEYEFKLPSQQGLLQAMTIDQAQAPPSKVNTFSLHGQWEVPIGSSDIRREDITPCQKGDWLILTGKGWFCRAPEVNP